MTHGVSNGHVTYDVRHVTPKGAVTTVSYLSDSLASCFTLHCSTWPSRLASEIVHCLVSCHTKVKSRSQAVARIADRTASQGSHDVIGHVTI